MKFTESMCKLELYENKAVICVLQEHILVMTHITSLKSRVGSTKWVNW